MGYAVKKVINDPQRVVIEALEGMAAAHPDLIRVSLEPKFVYRADAPRQGKVAVISGGGSGHEPMHGGFVGRGMLDAACPGRSLPRQLRTRCMRRQRRSTVDPVFS